MSIQGKNNSIMKKLLILLFSVFLLNSTSVFSKEDLSKVDVNSLNRLSGIEIIDVFNNTRLSGYYYIPEGIDGMEFLEFEEFHYSDGDFNHWNILNII